MTFYILLITLAISIWAFNSQAVMQRLIFNAYMVQENGQYYRFLTCGFIHADWLHLIINMMVFYSFGSQVEEAYTYLFGAKATWYFLVLYFGGIVISILPSYLKHRHQPGYNSLGASGGVAAITFSFILFNPLQKIYLYGIFGLPSILMGIAYLGYSFFMNKKGGDNVNHSAHFWGAIFGIIYTLALKPGLFMSFIQQVSDALLALVKYLTTLF
jgi:membrane associated rhomboid family serine protease